MINNYLEYVKDMRKKAIKDMRNYRAESKIVLTDWCIGFYAGHAQARSFEARRWRNLQKDMEAYNSYYECSLTDVAFDVAFDKLRRKQGGKHG